MTGTSQATAFVTGAAVLVMAHKEQYQAEDVKKYVLDLTGIYQIKNLITVLESCNQLNKLGLSLTDETIEDAVFQTKNKTGLLGRWQCIQQNPTIILDVAHNVDGMKQVIDQLKYLTYKKLHLIIGMVKDKDVNAVLELLPKNATYYFTKAQIERAMQEDDLQQLALNHSLFGTTFVNVNMALNCAKSNATIDDLILVCGSVFLIGEVE